ncbi:hypothetical protein [Acinetobacter modestus]|uniref:hypothetical protein n=1 Tax=Acinetobacter modestus TaxID=1776740 RepID=UPI003016A3DC
MNTQDERKAFENIQNEIQSWIAVKSFAAEDAHPNLPIIDANEIAEFVTEVFKKLEGCVVVPVNNTTIVAIEKMVEQQVEASGITEDVFRLDGEKILNAAVEAARGGNE